MNIQWNKILTADFWFALDSTQLHRVDWVIGGFGGLLLVIGIGFWLYSWKVSSATPRIRIKQVGSILFWAGLLEVVWLGLRYQRANALGTRFAAIVGGLLVLVWLYGPIKYFWKHYKNDILAEQKRLEKEKYLKM